LTEISIKKYPLKARNKRARAWLGDVVLNRSYYLSINGSKKPLKIPLKSDLKRPLFQKIFICWINRYRSFVELPRGVPSEDSPQSLSPLNRENESANRKGNQKAKERAKAQYQEQKRLNKTKALEKT